VSAAGVAVPGAGTEEEGRFQVNTDVRMEIVDLPLVEVYGNPDQPRKVFTAAELHELAESIKQSGLMQPITVAPRASAAGRYMIVAGERRWRASKLAGLATIKAIVRADLTDAGIAELALIENLLRRDLDVIEEAKAYQKFLDDGYTLDTLSKLLGHKTTDKVSRRLALLKLDPNLQKAVSMGAISATSGEQMSRLSVEGQFRVWNEIQDGKADTPAKIRRLVAAIFDQENQVALFQMEPVSEAQKASLGKVDRFINESGRLLTMITDDDLSVIREVLKADAEVCVERLMLLRDVCTKVANALAENAARQKVAA
jgi:ParB/RepB/Spo0J family partition protein